MSQVAPTLQAWFTQRLIGQRQVSGHTVAAYRDTFRLLFTYLAETTGKSPAELDFDDLDADAIAGFVNHLEQRRGVVAATRNARLAAVRSFLSFASFRHPEHAATIARVLAIPAKRTSRPLVTFLTRTEIDALLSAPDRTSWIGRRDHALLALDVQTGRRVSELTALKCADFRPGRGPHVRVVGKGRKERATPLTKQTVAIVTSWLTERGGGPQDAIFPGPSGAPLGRDAIRKLVVKHAKHAVATCPSLAAKQVGVHTLRHSCAMNLLQSGSTWRPSPYGSATKVFEPSNTSFTPTSPSKNRRWQGQPRPTPSPDDTGHPTPPSPSWRACNYADRITASPPASPTPQGPQGQAPTTIQHNHAFRRMRSALSVQGHAQVVVGGQAVMDDHPAVAGQQIDLAVHAQRLDLGPPARRGGRLDREDPAAQFPAAAHQPFCDVLGHLDGDLGQVEHLAGLAAHHLRPGQIRATTAGHRRAMPDPPIDIRALRKVTAVRAGAAFLGGGPRRTAAPGSASPPRAPSSGRATAAQTTFSEVRQDLDSKSATRLFNSATRPRNSPISDCRASFSARSRSFSATRRSTTSSPPATQICTWNRAEGGGWSTQKEPL